MSLNTKSWFVLACLVRRSVTVWWALLYFVLNQNEHVMAELRKAMYKWICFAQCLRQNQNLNTHEISIFPVNELVFIFRNMSHRVYFSTILDISKSYIWKHIHAFFILILGWHRGSNSQPLSHSHIHKNGCSNDRVCSQFPSVPTEWLLLVYING